MSDLADQLGELTGFRDRDRMDAALVVTLRELLQQPALLAIYRVVGQAPQQRWMTRARLAAADRAPALDPLWAELDTLPALHSAPLRVDVLHEQTVLSTDAEVDGQPGVCTVFPLGPSEGGGAVLELHTPCAPSPQQTRLVLSVLRIYRNFQALLDYSEHDTLTGLLNRQTFDVSFYKALGLNRAAASRAAQGLLERRHGGHAHHYIGLIDIDHFKQVNDGHGHLIGDEVLLLLSRLMRACFRFDDQLYRFGGEEFVVLMRSGLPADAAIAFERLRLGVEGYAFPKVGAITVSVGYTQLRADDTPISAFERADAAVYWAKAQGRNRVCDHTALLAAGAAALRHRRPPASA